MTQCINHPQYEAIEHCEHCHVPLCGTCLWYAESGERLCQRCAKQWETVGHAVYPPEQYADGIQPSLARPPASSRVQAPYSGNSMDLTGLAAACLGAMVLISCVPCMNIVTPLLALTVGIVAFVEAKRAIDPRRTRLLAGIGMVGALLAVLVAVGWLALSIGMPFLVLLVEAITQRP